MTYVLRWKFPGKPALAAVVVAVAVAVAVALLLRTTALRLVRATSTRRVCFHTPLGA